MTNTSLLCFLAFSRWNCVLRYVFGKGLGYCCIILINTPYAQACPHNMCKNAPNHMSLSVCITIARLLCFPAFSSWICFLRNVFGKNLGSCCIILTITPYAQECHHNMYKMHLIACNNLCIWQSRVSCVSQRFRGEIVFWGMFWKNSRILLHYSNPHTVCTRMPPQQV